MVAHQQEAYSVARQFNLIPPIAEQCEYSLLTRDKVELHMPEMFHKIGAYKIVIMLGETCAALTGI